MLLWQVQQSTGCSKILIKVPKRGTFVENRRINLADSSQRVEKGLISIILS